MDSCDSHGRSKKDGQKTGRSISRALFLLNLAQGLFSYGSF